MPSSISSIRQMTCTAGCQPSTDQTAWNTPHWTETRGIRFRNGTPEKIGGNVARVFDGNATISGVPRSEYSVQINGKLFTLIGTNTRLYSLIGSQLTNITPVDSDNRVTLGSNPLTSYYHTLASNPFATVNGSNTLTVQDNNANLFNVGDKISISGATTTNGISSTLLNAEHIIRSIVDSTHYTITVSSSATSTGSGGGSSVVRASSVIRINDATLTVEVGDRIKLSGSTSFAGYATGDINREYIVRLVTASYIYVSTDVLPTSSASGGGSAVVYDPPIASGLINVSGRSGYGVGRYGVGRYGVSKTGTSLQYPRIWCFDRYGDYILCSPCNQGNLYYWDGDVNVAPVQVTNSPDAINWFFVDNNIIVTLGANGYENRIKTSDQNGMTVWTATAENQVYDDNIEGADRWIGHINVLGVNLLFTEKHVYTFEYLGFDTAGTSNIWKIRRLGVNCGLIAPLACCVVNGVGYWMGENNFYMYRGGSVEIVPAATQKRATNQRYVFERINKAQAYKSFAWFNEAFEEINFHYTRGNEPDSVARFNITDGTWCNDVMNRTCAERPYQSSIYPSLMDYNGVMYKHECGTDDNGSPLLFSITSNMKNNGKLESRLTAFIPDSVMSGNATVRIRGYQWPQSVTPIKVQDFTITQETGRVEAAFNCRYWTYQISGNELGQDWSSGNWQEEIQTSGDGK